MLSDRVCMVGSDEEDEDGNLSDGEPVKGRRTKKKRLRMREVVYLPAVTSGFQPEEEEITDRPIPVVYVNTNSDNEGDSDNRTSGPITRKRGRPSKVSNLNNENKKGRFNDKSHLVKNSPSKAIASKIPEENITTKENLRNLRHQVQLSPKIVTNNKDKNSESELNSSNIVQNKQDQPKSNEIKSPGNGKKPEESRTTNATALMPPVVQRGNSLQNQGNRRAKYARQATPICDAIMKEYSKRQKLLKAQGKADNADFNDDKIKNLLKKAQTITPETKKNDSVNTTEQKTIEKNINDQAKNKESSSITEKDPLLITVKQEVITKEVDVKPSDTKATQNLSNTTSSSRITPDVTPAVTHSLTTRSTRGRKKKYYIDEEDEDDDPTYFPDKIHVTRRQTRSGRSVKLSQDEQEKNKISDELNHIENASTVSQIDPLFVHVKEEVDVKPVIVKTAPSEVCVTPVVVNNTHSLATHNTNVRDLSYNTVMSTPQPTRTTTKTSVLEKPDMLERKPSGEQFYKSTTNTPKSEALNVAMQLQLLAVRIANLFSNESNPNIETFDAIEAEKLLKSTQELLNMQKGTMQLNSGQVQQASSLNDCIGSTKIKQERPESPIQTCGDNSYESNISNTGAECAAHKSLSRNLRNPHQVEGLRSCDKLSGSDTDLPDIKIPNNLLPGSKKAGVFNQLHIQYGELKKKLGETIISNTLQEKTSQNVSQYYPSPMLHCSGSAGVLSPGNKNHLVPKNKTNNITSTFSAQKESADPLSQIFENEPAGLDSLFKSYIKSTKGKEEIKIKSEPLDPDDNCRLNAHEINASSAQNKELLNTVGHGSQIDFMPIKEEPVDFICESGEGSSLRQTGVGPDGGDPLAFESVMVCGNVIESHSNPNTIFFSQSGSELVDSFHEEPVTFPKDEVPDDIDFCSENI